MAVKKFTNMGWPQVDALWCYTPLSDPFLSSELQRLSFADSTHDTNIVSFQPCPNPEQANQDRYAISDWHLSNGTWSFRAIFDGHAGHDTASYTCSVLPQVIKDALADLVATDPTPEPSAISTMLVDVIASFDKRLGDALLDLFPNVETLQQLSDEQIRSVINDDGPNAQAILRCMRGTTVLLALTDPIKSNIWVASLGDCAAVLGTQDEAGMWDARILSSSHNGENPAEANKVKQEHPNEEEVMLDDRVLGAIAVTRAVGDYAFKLPAPYTHRVFLNSSPGFEVPEKVQTFTRRNFTPPYLSAISEVQHINLSVLGARGKFIMLCTDGMMDLYEDDRLNLGLLSKTWVEEVGRHYGEAGANLALKLLRHGLGGSNEEKVSRMITVEMAFRWMDDTTILVQKLS